MACATTPAVGAAGTVSKWEDDDPGFWEEGDERSMRASPSDREPDDEPDEDWDDEDDDWDDEDDEEDWDWGDDEDDDE